ncbi:DsbA family protein [Altererythrobacter aquiaggeris]|uniref:DsbA family protein n=1 Tax=Aestuarierythrobacter aquiaggeris TaxID=1898396 RepID=UPI003018FAB4
MNTIRRFSFAAIALPLSLAIAGCGAETAEGEAPEGDAIAAIEAPGGQAWSETVTVSEEDGYILGNPEAPVKLLEYASLTCPACAAFSADASEKIRDKYVASGVVSYELRNLIRGPDDLMLARLVRCGAKESMIPLSDQVWANLQALLAPIYENQEAAQQAMAMAPDQRFVAFANSFGITDFFAARGISRDQAQACLANPEELQAIADRSQTQSEELGIAGTPTFFINGRKIEGNQNWSTIEPMLQAAGAR